MDGSGAGRPAPRRYRTAPTGGRVPAPPEPAAVLSGEAQPDIANSRVATTVSPRKAVSRRVDFLGLSLPAAKGEEVRRECLPLYELGGGQGFAKGERVRCMGGEAQRRFQRVGKGSRRFGQDFESWEWSGGQADYWLRRLASDGDCSRVDVAWDFPCPEDFTACEVAEHILPQLHEAGIVPGVSGQGLYLTRYAGAMTSPARLRIYRKDVESPAFAGIFGPTIRIELVLRRHYARAFGRAFACDPEAAFGGAAERVASLCGLVVQDRLEPLPEVDEPPALDEGQRYFEFLQQNASRLIVYSESGLDVLADARLFVEQSRRETRWRAKRLMESVVVAGVQQIAAVFRMLLAGRVKGAA